MDNDVDLGDDCHSRLSNGSTFLVIHVKPDDMRTDPDRQLWTPDRMRRDYEVAILLVFDRRAAVDWLLPWQGVPRDSNPGCSRRLWLCFNEDGVVHDEGQHHRGQARSRC